MSRRALPALLIASLAACAACVHAREPAEEALPAQFKKLLPLTRSWGSRSRASGSPSTRSRAKHSGSTSAAGPSLPTEPAA